MRTKRGPRPPSRPTPPAPPAFGGSLPDAHHPLLTNPDAPTGGSTLAGREMFEAFAKRDDVPGALGVRELKFVITGADTDTPALHFMNTNINTLHYYFTRDVLGMDLTLEEFNRHAYFTDKRSFIAGTVVAYDSFSRPDGTPGLYAIEFWPTDPIGAQHVVTAFQLIEAAMTFAGETVAYHPTGDIQEQLFAREAEVYAARNVRTVSSRDLFDNVTYSPLNLGEAIGTLRVISPNDPRPPTPTDIVIYETLPNDLPLVAGVISAAPQTPLSHVNLRARQNNIPNAYLRDATTSAELLPFLGQSVRLIITPDAIEIQAASGAEVNAAFAARRPSDVQFPIRDLMQREITPLGQMTWDDTKSCGAKAANVAELRRILDPVLVPDGFAVPFSFYDDFMMANGLYAHIATQIDTPEFEDLEQRPDILKSIRNTIKDAPVPDVMRDQLDAMHRAFPIGTTPRCRSSANSEDMEGFTGAGLYNSYTHRLDEGHIEKSIKQVWSSLWTLRAYQERDFYRIDHMTSAMGVLVHPNFDDEQVNGVALTRNIYFPDFEGYYINAQVGEDLVTNPEAGSTPEEVLVIRDINLLAGRSYETIYVRRSDQVGADELVISNSDLMELVRHLKTIHEHFALRYPSTAEVNIAMDVEFKFDRDGKLAIKQARPWSVPI